MYRASSSTGLDTGRLSSSQPDSGQKLVASESLINRLLPEAGRGFDHMASSSGSDVDEALEAEPESPDSMPQQPRIGGPMRLRDRCGFLDAPPPPPAACLCTSNEYQIHGSCPCQ